MPQWTIDIWNVVKLVLPWLTGGLAGAILTNLISLRNQRKRTPRLLIRSEQVDFSLTQRDSSLEGLRVSYAGATYDNLILFQVSLENISTKSTGPCPLLLTLGAPARVIDHESAIRPVNRPSDWHQEAHEPGAYVWDPGDLKPGDSARLKIVADAKGAVSWAFRGGDDVEVVATDRSSSQPFENEVHSVIGWLGLCFIASGIPLLGGALTGFLLVLAAPRIVKYAQFMRAQLNRPHHNLPPQVVVGSSDADVSVQYDAIEGQSVVRVSPRQGAAAPGSAGAT
ncbi:hypothetical protein PLCT1_00128 [Planctomycetaceae bacterium]|nr:hypothetical protein PLCT1_00128 [Planctomycetaceae bacterium]